MTAHDPPGRPDRRPIFAGEVSGIDMRQPLTRDEVAAIDRRHGPIRRAGVPRPADRRRAAARVQPQFRRARDTRIGDMHRAEERAAGAGDRRHLQPRQGQRAVWRATTAGGCSASATCCGTPTARSSRPRRSTRCCAPRIIPSKGGNTEFADMRAAYDALDDETKAEIEDLVCEHCQIYSRGIARLHRIHRRGTRAQSSRCRSVWCARHPAAAGASLFLSAHAGDDRRLAGAGGARLPARPDRARDPARSSSTPTTGGVGDLVMWDNRADDAPRPPLRPDRGPRTAPHHRRRRPRRPWSRRRKHPVTSREGAPARE